MEESAFDAIYIGIYVFVFVIAVTATVFLYNSISEYADLAYEYAHKLDDSGVIEGAEVNKNNIISGDEVVSYYYNYVKKDKYDDNNESNYIVNINLNSKTETASLLTDTDLTYREVVQRIGISNKYLVEYSEQTADGKAVITISRIRDTDEVEEDVW